MSGLSRRVFLESTAGGGLLALADGDTAEKTKPLARAPAEALSAAVLGAGEWGTMLASLLSKIPAYRPIAVCDLVPERADAVAKGLGGTVASFTDWQKLLDVAKPDVVFVALPTHLHFPAAQAALERRAHVFCEAPLTRSAEQARDLVAAARDADRRLAVGQQRRANPVYHYAAELVRKKLIGDLVRVQSVWDRAEEARRPVAGAIDVSPHGYPTTNHLVNWRHFREYSAGVIVEMGVHQVDAARWLLDRRPVAVSALGASQFRDGRETHDVANEAFLFEDDYLAQISQDSHQSHNGGQGPGEWILGSAGALRVSAEAEIVFAPRGKAPSKRMPLGDLNGRKGFELPGASLTADELDRLKDPEAFAREAQLRCFAHCCANGGAPACSGETGRDSVIAALGAAEAAYDRKVFPFKDQWL